MDWNSPFVVYRITTDGKFEEVFHCHDIKKAKYWLTYIAQPGDVLCRTPAHPKHSKTSSRPEYCQHKVSSGKPSAAREDWEAWAREQNLSEQFPDRQLSETTL